MPRHVAFLRGVMPTNASMPALRAAFESAGFDDVKTILGTGNIAFTTPLADEATIETRAEAALQRCLGRTFFTVVRASAHLQALAAAEPYTAAGIPPHAKRIVSFLRAPQAPLLPLPLAQDQASVFLLAGREAFTAYVPTPRGPVFMTLIERAFGTALTTRSFDTVVRCASA